MNVNKLKGKMVELQINADGLAAKIGMHRSTLYRKMNDNTITVREAIVIKDALSLTNEEAIAIFFG